MDLTSVPHALLIGEAIDERRARTYGRLLDCAVLPPLAVRPSDTTGGYLRRAFAALAERYAKVPFNLTFAPYTIAAKDFLDDGQADDELAARDPVCVFIYAADGVHHIDASRFDQQVARCNRPLAAWLVEHVRRTTRGTFDAFTAVSAWECAAWGLFEGSCEDWWDNRRDELAQELRIAPAAVSGLQLRHYVRASELRTPGQIRRGLGRHHVDRRTGPLSLGACARLAADLPDSIRDRAQVVVEQASLLEAVRARIASRITRAEQRILCAIGAPAANPGLILETSRQRLVSELLEDLYESVASETGFAPNCTLVLNATTRSAQRLRQTLDDLATASAAVAAIATAMTLDDGDDEGSACQ